MISTRSNLSQHTNRQLLLQQPFAHSNAYQYSFVSNTVRVWNLLPESVINLPFQHLRVLLIVTYLKIAYCVYACLTHCLTLLYLPFWVHFINSVYCYLCILCLLHKVLYKKKKVSGFWGSARGSRWAVAIIKVELTLLDQIFHTCCTKQG